ARVAVAGQGAGVGGVDRGADTGGRGTRARPSASGPGRSRKPTSPECSPAAAGRARHIRGQSPMAVALVALLGARPARARLAGVAAAGVSLLLLLAGSARATSPTAALPPDLPEAERARLRAV